MESFEPFLRSTEIVDWSHPAVLEKSRELSSGESDCMETACRCFKWVHDHIQHRNDFQRNPVACSVSETLLAQAGYCCAKNHLLAALLRANNILAGFCHQQLSINDTAAPYSLHGLNAVHLPRLER